MIDFDQTCKVAMENVNLIPLLEQLDDNVDDLEEALTPLLKHDLSSTAGKLPLLDKAHLYVLITYAIESILFCKYKAELRMSLTKSPQLTSV